MEEDLYILCQMKRRSNATRQQHWLIVKVRTTTIEDIATSLSAFLQPTSQSPSIVRAIGLQLHWSRRSFAEGKSHSTAVSVDHFCNRRGKMRRNDRKLVGDRGSRENEPPNFTTTTTTFTHHEETDRKQSIFSYCEASTTTSAHKPILQTDADTVIPHHPTMKMTILSSSSPSQRQHSAALDETMSTLSITSKLPTTSANNESGLCSTTAATGSQRNKSTRNKVKKAITFGTVSTYFFPTILGDSPAVRDGCPIALGSKCVSMQTLDLRTHEMMVMAEQQQLYNERYCQPRQRNGPHNQPSDADGTVPYCPTRLRRGNELYIPVLERSKLLIDHGYSIHEIVKAVMAVEDAKKLRAESIKMYKWQSKIKGMIDFAGNGRKNSILRKVLTVNNNNNNSTSIQKKNQDGNSTSSSSVSSGKPRSVQARSA